MTVERERPLSLAPVLLAPPHPTPRLSVPASLLAHTPGEDRPEGTGGAQAPLGTRKTPLPTAPAHLSAAMEPLARWSPEAQPPVDPSLRHPHAL